MTTPHSAHEVSATPHFNFVYGKYDLSNWRIPYFSANMAMGDAAENLQLVSDFPDWHKMEWKLEELYQRDLDWPRVESEIVPYLSAVRQPQFFNSLTIALLPMRDKELKDDYGGGFWDPPRLDQNEYEFQKTVNVGPISLGYYQEWDSVNEPAAELGKMRWNRDQVFGVAIDGQHRLAAIKSHVENIRGTESIRTTSVPVIFLVFDERVGFDAPEGEWTSTVGLLRRLFIDLNKNAEPVSRTREILLDDRDPFSLCIRELVGERLKSDLDDLDPENSTTPRLPLSLVDWHTDSAKFEDGPYLATILGLDYIVSEVMGANPIDDYMEYRSIERQISSFEKSLGIDLGSAHERIDTLKETQSRPFYYTDSATAGEDNELERIQRAFRKVYNRPLTKLLTQFRPYRDFIKARREEDTFTDEFINWYYFRSRKKDDRRNGRATQEYRQFVRDIEDDLESPVPEKQLENKLAVIDREKGDNLAFKVVFQRALVLALVKYLKIQDEHIRELSEAEEMADVSVLDDISHEDAFGEDDEDDVEARARFVRKRVEEFVGALNRFVDQKPEFLDKRCSVPGNGSEEWLWSGSIWRPEGTIDYTKGASRRAREVLLWIPLMDLIVQKGGEALRRDYDQVRDRIDSQDNYLFSLLQSSRYRFYREDRSAAARILEADDIDYKADKAQHEADIRLRWVWGTLRESD